MKIFQQTPPSLQKFYAAYLKQRNSINILQEPRVMLLFLFKSRRTTLSFRSDLKISELITNLSKYVNRNWIKSAFEILILS